MRKINTRGFSCDNCGKDLQPDDLVSVCSDCGAIFCEDCQDEFLLHECEPDDYED